MTRSPFVTISLYLFLSFPPILYGAWQVVMNFAEVFLQASYAAHMGALLRAWTIWTPCSSIILRSCLAFCLIFSGFLEWTGKSIWVAPVLRRFGTRSPPLDTTMARAPVSMMAFAMSRQPCSAPPGPSSGMICKITGCVAVVKAMNRFYNGWYEHSIHNQ